MIQVWKVLAVGVALTCLLAADASADTIKVLHDTGSYSSSSGGEFLVSEFSGSITLAALGSGVSISSSYFQTFCIERTETLSPGTTYDWVLNTAAVLGGGSTDPESRPAYAGNPDPLSPETAWLFTQFWDGALSGYDYTAGAGRAADAADLQDALWYLEGEITTLGSLSAQAQGWVTAAQATTWTDLGQVRVLNLYAQGHPGENNYRKQDVLVKISNPTTTEIVPLPPAAFMGASLLFGSFIFSRVRRRVGPRS